MNPAANSSTISVVSFTANALYDSLSSNLSEINSSTGSMNIPDGLGEELTQMKNTINELNAKYAAMLEGMK